MQKLKKRFALLLGICLFNSCGSLPKRPSINLCAHDEPNRIAECFNNQSEEFSEIKIEDTNRFIMMSPDDWGLILIYIDKLRRSIRNKTMKNELQKVINTSKKHNDKNIKFNTQVY